MYPRVTGQFGLFETQRQLRPERARANTVKLLIAEDA